MNPLPSAEESPRPSPRSIPDPTSHAGYRSCPRSWCRSLPLLSACARRRASPRCRARGARRQAAAAVAARRERLAAVARGWPKAGPRRPARIDRCWAGTTSSIQTELSASGAAPSTPPCWNSVKLYFWCVWLRLDGAPLSVTSSLRRHGRTVQVAVMLKWRLKPWWQLNRKYEESVFFFFPLDVQRRKKKQSLTRSNM